MAERPLSKEILCYTFQFAPVFGSIWITLMAVAVCAGAQTKPTIHLEAEKGQLVDTSVAVSFPGYSGSGYVTEFTKDDSKVVLTFDAPGGLYTLRIRFRTPSGAKGYDLKVDGEGSSGMFDQSQAWAVHTAGKVELKPGSNTLEIDKGWGWFDVDSVDLIPAAPDPAPKRLSPTLIDPKATPAARKLMAYLVSGYGSRTLSGQYGWDDAQYIKQNTGKYPAILGGDFMDYSPSRIAFGANPKDGTEQMVQKGLQGWIVTMSWHWNAPKDLINKISKDQNGNTVDNSWYKGFYTSATTFDVQYALSHPDSEDRKLLLRDIDAIGFQLKKFDDAGVPVLWRPLHEASGGWFWWGAKGPEPFKALWRLLYDRLTNYHHLHNLIWVYTDGDPKWYPGDRYVDVVGIDVYPSDPNDPLSGNWEDEMRRFDGKKLVAVTEFGGVPDVAKMQAFGAHWAYWVSWIGDLGPKKMTKAELAETYRLGQVATHDKLPAAFFKSKRQ